VGNHGLPTAKITHQEEFVRIPAIFHGPGKIAAQGQMDGMFGLVDLQATVCGLIVELHWQVAWRGLMAKMLTGKKT
jgi:arylsulfatase A-like enzyme